MAHTTLHLLLLLCSLILLVSAAEEVTPTLLQPRAATSTVPQYADDGQFEAAILNSTNFYRYEHAAPGLSWNASLAKYAADFLAGDNCAFEHSNGPDGENIAHGYPDVTTAVQAWGDERSIYDFDNPAWSEETGHFTQLVWQATRTVGCGRRWCSGDTGWLLACEYWPRGNILSEFATQVHSQINGSMSPHPASWCPQGAACDGAANLRVPWVFERNNGLRGVVALAALGAWAWL